jgi:hypothetical protein
MFCTECGNEVAKGDKFCKQCGYSIIEENLSVRKTLKQSEVSNYIKCPICGEHDAVAKVSTIVKSGSYSGAFSGPTTSVSYSDGKWGIASGVTTMSGTTITDLARILSPPAHPSTLKSIGRGCLYPIYIYLGLVVIGILLFIYWGMVGDEVLRNLQDYLSLTLCSIFFGAIGLIPYFLIKKKINVDQNKYLKYKPKWENAMRNWQRLYYCGRDDIVFDPTTKIYGNSGELNNIIFQ